MNRFVQRINIKKHLIQSGVFLLALLVSSSAVGQNVFSGSVFDRSSGEPLIGASVYNKRTGLGSVTTFNGSFTLSRVSISDTLSIRYVGYESMEVVVTTENVKERQTIRLKPAVVNADEILVVANHSVVKETGMSAIRVSPQELKNLPTFMGMNDIVKSLHFMPGVSSGNEGTSGVFVRGGGQDQTLILLDGVPMYQAFHSAGFISAFSSSILQSGTFYTGGFPAKFGGRLSGVLDLQVKEGNKNKRGGEIDLGIISAEGLVEIPWGNGKNSLLISARKSTFNEAINKLGLDNARLLPITEFHDVLVKSSHSFSSGKKLTITAFSARDLLGDESTTSYPIPNFNPPTFNFTRQQYEVAWKNRFLSATLVHPFQQNWLTKWNLYGVQFYSGSEQESENRRQRTELDELVGFYASNVSNNLSTVSGSVDLLGSTGLFETVEMGIKLSASTFSIGTTALSIDNVTGIQIENSSGFAPKDRMQEAEFYVTTTKELGRTSVQTGVRGHFVSVENQNYFSLQPRAGFRTLLTEKLSLKGSLAYMSQPVHAVVSNSIGISTDFWVPSTSNSAPQHGYTASVGLAAEPNRHWTLTAETFYREMQNVLEFKQGSSIFSQNFNWESQTAQGEGRAYGLEVLVRRSRGRLVGSLSYTFSKSIRKFDELNQGRDFPFKFDRTHNLSMTGQFAIIKNRLDLGISWTGFSGHFLTAHPYEFTFFPAAAPIQPPVGGGLGQTYRFIPERNNYRLPAYHRLDLALTGTLDRAHFKTRFRTGFYNAYNNRNPVYAAPGIDYRTGERGLQLFFLFPIVPFISLGVQF